MLNLVTLISVCTFGHLVSILEAYQFVRFLDDHNNLLRYYFQLGERHTLDHKVAGLILMRGAVLCLLVRHFIPIA